MQKKHIPKLAELETLCFSRPWSQQGFIAELSNPCAFFYTAQKDDTILGYIGIHIVSGEGYIANIAVSPLYRRQGIAAALLSKALETAVSQSADFLSLEVRKSNLNAIRLYEKAGFEIMGERRGFYSAPTENAFIMTKNLSGEM